MKKAGRSPPTPLFEVRHSRVHGYGVFALRRIRKGTHVIEYLGERVSPELADAAMQASMHRTATRSCLPSMTKR
jgi:SET domain-containing protein